MIYLRSGGLARRLCGHGVGAGGSGVADGSGRGGGGGWWMSAKKSKDGVVSQNHPFCLHFYPPQNKYIYYVPIYKKGIHNAKRYYPVRPGNHDGQTRNCRYTHYSGINSGKTCCWREHQTVNRGTPTPLRGKNPCCVGICIRCVAGRCGLPHHEAEK